MVLPLLLGIGLPALGATGALGATLAGFSAPVLAGMGTGLGSFLQTGDLGKGIQTGLTSFLGGKILGGLSNSTAMPANAGAANAVAAPKPALLDSIIKPSPSVADIAKGPSSNLANTLFGEAAAQSPAPFINEANAPNATKGGAFTAGQQAFTPAFMGQSMTDAQLMEEQARKAEEEREANKITTPMPNPMQRSYNPTPYYNNTGTGSFINYERRPRADGSEVQAPYYYSEGGKLNMSTIAEKAMELFGDVSESSIGKVMRMLTPMSGGIADLMGASGEDMPEGLRKLGKGLQRVGSYTLPPYALKGMGYDRAADVMGYPFDDEGELRPQYKAEGGEVEQPDAMREDQLILNSIRAVKGEFSTDRAQSILGEFLEEYGEEALKDLVDKTKSGAYDETADRFARGEKGIVRGPGDGSGEDDKVPALLEGTDPVLLTEDEFVIRQPTQEALTKAFGGGFLDKVNQAEEAAPEVLKKMVG